jgi:dienelactone hydrolase
MKSPFSLLGLVLLLLPPGTRAAAPEINVLTTPEGIEFGLLGSKRDAPAPTVFVFSQDHRTTLTVIETARLLAARGFLCVSLDAPCHGKDNPEKFTNALAGWAERLKNGGDLIHGFTAKCRKVLDHLIAEGYADPSRIAACGQSRGGFLALHVMAADPRISAAAAFAPVTDLLALGEFKGLERSAAVTSLALAKSADRLAGRPVWICIGNKDRRVDTDAAIAFTRAVVEASVAQNKPALVELRVVSPAPYLEIWATLPEKERQSRLSKGHFTYPTAHQDVAAWIEAQLRRNE